MYTQGIGLIVGGTAASIAPCRAVTLDSAGTSRQVIQQSVQGARCYGIAQDAQKNAPGVTGSSTVIAAETGDPILVYPGFNGGNCLAEFGASATIDDELISDANGRLIPMAHSGAGLVWVVAICTESVTLVGTNYPRVSVQLAGYWKYFAS